MTKRRLVNVFPGFTIVELLVVIVVIGILAAITIVAYSGISNRAIISSMQSDLSNASTTLKLDYTSNSTFPATLALANNGKGITPSQSLDNIIYIPDNTSNPNNFCLQYRKGTNNYAVDNTSSVSSGVCLQNMVTNGDFSGGITGWGGDGATNLVANNILDNTASGVKSTPAFYQSSGAKVIGNKYYIKLKERVTNASCLSLRGYIGGALATLLTSPTMNTWYTASTTITAVSTNDVIQLYHYYADAATASGKVMEAQQVLAIDLTATFGAGNEPTTAQMDTIMAGYPNSWFNIVAKASL